VEENLYLVMGCWGRQDDGFISCPSVENRILHIHSGLENYDAIMDYLDSVRLFDRPLYDNNAIRHLIYNMQDKYLEQLRPIWNPKRYDLLEKFIVSHKSCGVYVKLCLINPELEPKKEERSDDEAVFVQAAPNLKLVDDTYS